MTATPSPLARPGFTYSLLLAIGMAAAVGAALGFQYIGGYIPCALCLLQRQPYYYAIPIAIIGAVSSLVGLPNWITRALILAAGVLMLVTAGMGVYHAGVEWHFWPGPATCSTTANGMTSNAGDLLTELNTIKGPSCTDAALRVLGLSFAGWNVIAGILLAAFAFVGVRKSA
ncbi:MULTISPECIES: disulfide bond formation protein B [Rhizobium]|uniref:Disulfide bond formation protein B n=1 Tax=Rhizobium bangladeshense TaxID=1138189 RepID=A0ABS7LRI6_9HYPH|nr:MULTISPECIES: disulfide bond formation protein B [Rhizobium]MBX4870983.1 disulfide bond formation protein B [Rhizobium bangladeshense]MBX4876707.1 disulfide bond formation protein B [Rhizobium bangladeshense]MBX4887512.1 disulfide bond formation protein B [Rhizobium bangladeshense]MBX4893601.1 disulfide bond formation protein B [Rhizobium bangladeshense]MBX4918008.1 disulfide bond formation protein B [Rhizobium bangladeshense]